MHELVAELGLEDRVRFVPPQSHEALAPYYRAADVVLVPSRTESFGLVALEAAACGTPSSPPTSAACGRSSTTGDTGFLVPEPRTGANTRRMSSDLLRDPASPGDGRRAPRRRSGRYTWSITAARLRRLYADLPRAAVPELVQCT